MKNQFVCVMLATILLVGCSTHHGPSTTIKLGLKEADVIELLTDLGATDITEHMSALMSSVEYGIAPPVVTPKLTGGMWSLERPDFSIEIRFTDGILTEINLWDWRNRKMTSYHHMMRYEEVSSVTFWPESDSFSRELIKTHNAEDG